MLQIKAIYAARGIPLPETRSVGQGKPLKFDLLKTLIQACFPDEADEAIEKLVKKQAQNPNSIIPEAEQLGTAEAEDAQAELLIRMTATLSPHEADHFSDIRQQAVEHLHARRERRKTQFKISARGKVSRQQMHLLQRPLNVPLHPQLQAQQLAVMRPKLQPRPALAGHRRTQHGAKQRLRQNS